MTSAPTSTASHALGNEIAGVFIQTASNNTIGSTTAGGSNLISGNMQGGVRIVGTSTLPATGNQVLGNSIGTTAERQQRPWATGRTATAS